MKILSKMWSRPGVYATAQRIPITARMVYTCLGKLVDYAVYRGRMYYCRAASASGQYSKPQVAFLTMLLSNAWLIRELAFAEQYDAKPEGLSLAALEWNERPAIAIPLQLTVVVPVGSNRHHSTRSDGLRADTHTRHRGPLHSPVPFLLHRGPSWHT